MTFEILKTPDPEPRDTYDSATDRAAIITGLTDGTIKNLRDAVRVVNTASNKKLGGDDIKGDFKALVKELKDINKTADRMAAEGKTILEIVAALTGGSFDIDQIKAMKVEIYGSITAWKTAMQNKEA